MNLAQAYGADPTMNARARADAAAYINYRDALSELMRSKSPRDTTRVKRHQDALLKLRTLTPGSVHVDSVLTNISIQYKNEEYIGDYLLPIVSVGKMSGLYFKYDKRSRLAYPDDEMGYRASANELNDARNTDSYSTRDYGFKNYLDVKTIENEDAPLDEMAELTEAINEGIAFKREARQAAILTNAANYGSNTTAISSGNRWDTSGGGTIIADMQTAVASLWTGRGPSRKVGFCNIDAWNAIARNAVIRGLFQYTSGEGLATTQMVARYFGLDDIYVGAARQDTANEGQTAAYSRMWPSGIFGVVRVATRPSLRTASFGYTMRHRGEVNTDQWFDPSIGTKGGYYARVSVSDDYKVVAADTGYLLTTVTG